MSKKSRRRNKKILAAIGLGLGAVALANRKKKSDLASTEDGKSGSTKITGGTNLNDYDAGTKKPVAKPDTTPKDTQPKDTQPKKIVNTSRSRMMRPNPKAGGEAMGPNETNLYNKKNKMPDTASPSIDNPYKSRVIKGGRLGIGRSLKSGGRAGLKSGGKAIKKSMGKALRGGGKVMR